MVIGSFARDIYALWEAGGTQSIRGTQDIDLAFAYADSDNLESLQHFGEPTNGTISRMLGPYQVDILPFSRSQEGIQEYRGEEGQAWIVTGLREAFEHSVLKDIGTGLQIRVPTLAGLLGLKLIAWGTRGYGESRDAQDWVYLLDCYHRLIDEDSLYNSEYFSGDPVGTVGIMAAVDVKNIFDSSSLNAMTTVLQDMRYQRVLEGYVERHGLSVPDIYQASTPNL
ncbi:MAG: hypothetical protein Q4P78_00870 [Rothia sp. (in: high G+C Gram-positive bacteria)]|uniref:hypothetical protein n=1 Tax=Rothia sp. (in: high G+C Gram-positive bacteria) TaxID=1885016 RepID=UPI0026DF3D78|nr:hypothetical protein [Rothia sp. (in: high G+C Gram-positive bacteria)]MDO5749742.1 hypothetical protein [Rothia sp. (in: high G+C Gram-positive bacteria)]